MFLRRFPAYLAIGLLVASCGHALPEMPEFDGSAWRKDPYGCTSRRAALLPSLTKYREQLYGARISDVDALLGHPDEEELSEQSEKIYIYYTATGPQCVKGHPRAAGGRVVLRFGATGTITEAQFPVSTVAP